MTQRIPSSPDGGNGRQRTRTRRIRPPRQRRRRVQALRDLVHDDPRFGHPGSRSRASTPGIATGPSRSSRLTRATSARRMSAPWLQVALSAPAAPTSPVATVESANASRGEAIDTGAPPIVSDADAPATPALGVGRDGSRHLVLRGRTALGPGQTDDRFRGGNEALERLMPPHRTMSSTVYIETSVIGYLTSRPSRDLLTAAKPAIDP